jgi:hypothetical protein
VPHVSPRTNPFGGEYEPIPSMLLSGLVEAAPILAILQGGDWLFGTVFPVSLRLKPSDVHTGIRLAGSGDHQSAGALQLLRQASQHSETVVSVRANAGPSQSFNHRMQEGEGGGYHLVSAVAILWRAKDVLD